MSDSDKKPSCSCSSEANAFAGGGKTRGNFPPGKFGKIRGLKPGNHSPQSKNIPDQHTISLPHISAKGVINNANNFSEVKKYFHQQIVIVEVKDGESKKEAWRRHLLSHPHSAKADVKIFHYH